MLFVARVLIGRLSRLICKEVSSGNFPHGLADAADESGWKGSNVYEINRWLWPFGRGKPRLGGLSVAETEERRIADY